MTPVSYFAVQLCGPYSGSSGHDSEAVRTRNWLQNHGPGAGLDEGQEKGKFTVLFQRLTVEVVIWPGRFYIFYPTGLVHLACQNIYQCRELLSLVVGQGVR
jgi:hypothetical protein